MGEKPSDKGLNLKPEEEWLTAHSVSSVLASSCNCSLKPPLLFTIMIVIASVGSYMTSFLSLQSPAAQSFHWRTCSLSDRAEARLKWTFLIGH